MPVALIRSSIVAGAMLCLAVAAGAEEFACSPDQCMEKINGVAKTVNPSLVTAKETCKEEGTDRRCYYRSKSGPGISLISKSGSNGVQAMVIADRFGLSPAGGLYISVIMEAFDTSLDIDARKEFYNKLLGDFAQSFQSGGLTQMESAKLKYVLSSLPDKTFTIFGVSHAK
jgi:hypothetical protein